MRSVRVWIADKLYGLSSRIGWAAAWVDPGYIVSDELGDIPVEALEDVIYDISPTDTPFMRASPRREAD